MDNKSFRIRTVFCVFYTPQCSLSEHMISKDSFLDANLIQINDPIIKYILLLVMKLNKLIPYILNSKTHLFLYFLSMLFFNLILIHPQYRAYVL